LSPGALILSGINPSLPDISSCVDISDHLHLGTPPFMISLAMPPQGSGLCCLLCTDTYHNLPYISSFASATPLSQHLLLHGQHNSSFWMLSLDSKEFITAVSVVGPQVTSMCRRSPHVHRIPYKSGQFFPHFLKEYTFFLDFSKLDC
jgi:hypothetical protein